MPDKTLHDSKVLDNEHDVRIVLGAAVAIAGLFGAWAALGLGPDQVAMLLASLGSVAAVATRRVERKRRKAVVEALSGDASPSDA